MEAGTNENGNDDELISRRFRFLYVSRAARSIGIVFVTLSLQLYLLSLHVSVTIIGVLLLLMVVFSLGISLVSGALGDRIGYKYSLLLGDAPMVISTFILAFAHTVLPIEIATIIGGIGGTPGGLRGVFAPGLNALIARNWPNTQDRVKRMGNVMAVGSVSAIGGAVLLYAHGYLQPLYGSSEAYRLLYLANFVLGLISFVSIMFLKERKATVRKKGIIDRKSGKYTLKVIAANLVNGSGLGFSIALLPAWMAIRFGATTSTVGLMFSISYAATAVGSITATRFIDRTRSPIWTASVSRVLQGALIVAVAFAPAVFIVTAIYSVRSAIAGYGAPIRTAINVKGISDSNFGIASSAQGMAVRSSQGTSAISGYVMEYAVPLPLEIGGILQLLGGLVYYRLLKGENK